METFELRYFLGVAETENIHKASEKLSVSPGSLSKAISRLEDELSVKLFHKEGRNIRLTEHGKLLQVRAAEIIRLEEAAKWELSGKEKSLKIIIGGPEVSLSLQSTSLIEEISKITGEARFEFRAVDDETALRMLQEGEIHLAIIAKDLSIPEDCKARLIQEIEFKTYVSDKHPLHKKRNNVDVSEVLEHSFVVPGISFYGVTGTNRSLDGWRDDKFPRKTTFVASSVKILETLVSDGKAVAYLPEAMGNSLSLSQLKMSGCPYTCKQKIKLVAQNPKDISWMKELFDL